MKLVPSLKQVRNIKYCHSSCACMFCFTCCTSCRGSDMRLHVRDNNNTADRLTVYQNIQVVGKLNLNRGQSSDWLWNLKPLYWKRPAHASFNSFSAWWPGLTRNSPESHAMSTQNDPSSPQHMGSDGPCCTRKTELIRLYLSIRVDFYQWIKLNCRDSVERK